MSDPTAFAIHFDPRERRMTGYTRLGNMYFDVPFVSEIGDNLWQGGCQDGLVLPDFFDHIISMYPWEEYTINHDVKSQHTIKMYDSEGLVDREQVVGIAEIVNECRKTGVTLVHCQAGLNRSALIAGLALILEGGDPAEVVATLREKRSPAVLCNRSFEKFLLEFEV